MNRLSVCIITLNEEGNLSRALDSLKEIADEIVVVDCGSTDRTAEIAREHGAAWFERSWTNFADQKNYAAECASADWVFSMDADEELSSPLQTSLLAWKKHTPEYCVYEASRKTFYLGAWIEHSGWYPDFQRRLYRRDETEFSGIVHESLRPVGAADVRRRQAQMERRDVVCHAVELVPEFRAARRLHGRLSRRADRENG